MESPQKQMKESLDEKWEMERKSLIKETQIREIL